MVSLLLRCWNDISCEVDTAGCFMNLEGMLLCSQELTAPGMFCPEPD
jgi:hypothetical protein